MPLSFFTFPVEIACQAGRENGLGDGVVQLAGQARAFFEDGGLLLGRDLGGHVLNHRQQDLVALESERADVHARMEAGSVVAKELDPEVLHETRFVHASQQRSAITRVGVEFEHSTFDQLFLGDAQHLLLGW